MTVYGRMTLGLSILTLLTLGAAFLVISVVLDTYQERQLDEDLLQVARAEAAEAPENGFSFAERSGPARNDVGPLEKYGVIFDENGKVMNATEPFDRGAPQLAQLSPQVDTPFDFAFGVHTYRGVVVPIPGYANRRLLLSAWREDLDNDSRFVRKAMTIALVVSVGWLVAAVSWLVRWNMREHERIAEKLHLIAMGDVNVKVSEEVSDHELRRVGSDIDEIAQRLARLVGHQRRFIAHAAHELRSPLAALHGEIQQALRKERTVEEYRKSLGFLLKASGRLKHLADDLLELARAEQASKASEPVPIELAFADVIESLEPLAKEKDVTIERDATDCVVEASRNELDRILRNLLDNAIRHSPQGGCVRLEVEAGEIVRIRVRDQGQGVSQEERERIFEPFHRSPLARTDSRGSGLGLSIARELARRHRGDLAVDEDGNCFVVSLPRPRPASAASTGELPSEERAAS